MGVYGPIDVFYISGGSMGTSIFGGKLQILGDSRLNADAKNLSIAIVAGYGEEADNKHEGEDLELVPKDEDTFIKMTKSRQTIGLLISYRTTKNFIIQNSYFITQHNFYGDLESENANLDGKGINYHGTAHIFTIGARYYLNPEKVFVGFEIANENTKWNRSTEPFQHTHFNVNVGHNW